MPCLPKKKIKGGITIVDRTFNILNLTQCDGARPACSNCVTKSHQCSYDIKPDETKSRSEALEKLFRAIQNCTSEEAESLLQRIRSSEDFLSLCENTEINGQGASQDEAVRQTSDSVSDTVEIQERTQNSTIQAILTIPEFEVIQEAIEGFFICSGKLFHVFSREQVAQHYENMVSGSGVDQKAGICCVTAVAAVGAQYSASTLSRSIEQSLYNIARHYVETVIEAFPLDAIKVCTLLAMFNIMNKATISLTYVGTRFFHYFSYAFQLLE